MVGWRHDVVEDTGVTLDDLREDFPEEIVTGADAMTRRQGGETSTTGVWPLIPWRVPWNRRIGTTAPTPPEPPCWTRRPARGWRASTPTPGDVLAAG